MRSHLLAAFTMLLLAGCQRAPVAPDATPATAASTPQPLPATVGPASPEPPLPPDGAAPYRCDDGRTLDVRFTAAAADLQWPDGREARLPRAESASKGDGDVYVGDTVSLQRDGDRFQLHEEGRSATNCTRSTVDG